MKTEPYFYPQPNHLTPRTAIARDSDSGALKSAVFNFVFFVMLKNKFEQSAKTKLLLNFWYKKYDHMFDET